MKRSMWVWCVAVALAGAVTVSAQDHLAVPVGGGDRGIDDLVPVAMGRLQVDVERADDADGNWPALSIAFEHEDESPRFLALSAKQDGLPDGLRRLNIRYRLALDEGDAPRMAIAFVERSGSFWFNVGREAVAGGFRDGRIPIGALRLAAFSEDESGQLEWADVERIWVGVVLPGKCA